MSLGQSLKQRTLVSDFFGYHPLFFRLNLARDRERMAELLSSQPALFIHDTLTSQLGELWRCRNPQVRAEPAPSDLLGDAATDGPHESYGVWVYYPWASRLVHLLDEAEFVEVRTNRNQLRITKEEQLLLESKTVGVLGLSVGSSIAVTLATERCCGKLRLADFDTLELSNLNRVRAPVHALGTSKAIFTAREIAEIDPFLEVTCITTPVDGDNLEAFFLEPCPMDLCVEECDDLALKILVRKVAREHRVPVLMETNDRGMLDVERYDHRADRPLLHGLVSDLEAWDSSHIRGLSDQQKVPYLMDIVGSEGLSRRTRASLGEVGKTLKSWPQLASAVTRGAGVTADMARRILLDHCSASGRFYSILSLSPADEDTLDEVNDAALGRTA